MNKRKGLAAFSISLLVVLFCLNSRGECETWKFVEEGLYLAEFPSPQGVHGVEYPVVILKIDPKFYDFKLLCASEHDRRRRTVGQWGKEFGLFAAINASMYQNEHPLKSTGYMKNYKHVNNSHFNPVFGAFMVFNPAVSTVPKVRILDRHLQEDWKNVVGKYNTVVQNYRMISHGKKAGWPQQSKIYETAAIGMDKDENVLFILGKSPSSTHDFIHLLLSFPIDIRHAMYVEGGPEAALYVRIVKGGRTWEDRIDSAGSEKINSGYTIPNVIGIVKRR